MKITPLTAMVNSQRGILSFTDYKTKRHGQEDLIGSFADSCNSSFASLGLTLNPDSFTELCDSMLFNTSLPLRFESSKSSFSLDADADVSTVLETSIGQGKTLVTPMHMALVVSAIANDGVLMNPYLIDHTENYNGIVVDAYEPTEYGTLLSTEDCIFNADLHERSCGGWNR